MTEKSRILRRMFGIAMYNFDDGILLIRGCRYGIKKLDEEHYYAYIYSDVSEKYIVAYELKEDNVSEVAGKIMAAAEGIYNSVKVA